MIKNFKIAWSLLSAIVFVGFIFPGWVQAADPTKVFVSILPQKYFVEQIGKDLVDVRVMVKPGTSPVTYEPKPKQLADVSKAMIYFSIGVPFEKVWLKKIAAANPQMKVVHTDHGIEKIPMAAHARHGGSITITASLTPTSGCLRLWLRCRHTRFCLPFSNSTHPMEPFTRPTIMNSFPKSMNWTGN